MNRKAWFGICTVAWETGQCAGLEPHQSCPLPAAGRDPDCEFGPPTTRMQVNVQTRLARVDLAASTRQLRCRPYDTRMGMTRHGSTDMPAADSRGTSLGMMAYGVVWTDGAGTRGHDGLYSASAFPCVRADWWTISFLGSECGLGLARGRPKHADRPHRGMGLGQ